MQFVTCTVSILYIISFLDSFHSDHSESHISNQPFSYHSALLSYVCEECLQIAMLLPIQ